MGAEIWLEMRRVQRRVQRRDSPWALVRVPLLAEPLAPWLEVRLEVRLAELLGLSRALGELLLARLSAKLWGLSAAASRVDCWVGLSIGCFAIRPSLSPFRDTRDRSLLRSRSREGSDPVFCTI